MTPRQKEFCRHYLRGLSAPRAARAAGYSACTAEKNAATILSSESVSRYLEGRRAASIIITPAHLLAGRDRMLKVIAEGDDKAAAIAFHALLRLKRLEPQLAADDSVFAPQQQQLSPSPRGEGLGVGPGASRKAQLGVGRASPQPTTRNPPQRPDNQQSAQRNNTTENIPETDNLPTGTESFGHRLSPLKAEVAVPKTPIHITFRNSKYMRPDVQPSHLAATNEAEAWSDRP